MSFKRTSQADILYTRTRDSGTITWSGSGNYYTVGGGIFTIIRGGIASYASASSIAGSEITWMPGQSVSISNNSVNHIYFDNRGIIGKTSTLSLSLFEENVVLFTVVVDTAGNVNVVDQCHTGGQDIQSMWAAKASYGTAVVGGGAIPSATAALEVSTTGGSFTIRDQLLSYAGTDTSPVSWHHCMNLTAGWSISAVSPTFLTQYVFAGVATALVPGDYAAIGLYVAKGTKNSSAVQYYVIYDTSIHATQAAVLSSLIENSHNCKPSGNLLGLDLANIGFVVISNTAIVDVHTFRSTSGGGGGTSDHTLLTNIGTNTHAQIDGHIGDSAIHFTAGSIDHGSIGGLLDDDHTQYFLADGTRAISGDIVVSKTGAILTFEDTVRIASNSDPTFTISSDFSTLDLFDGRSEE